MWETVKKDPLIKTIVVVLLGVLAFGFAFNIMFGSGGSSMEDGSMMSSGYSLGNTLEYIIALLIKVVIIGLLIGTIVWLFRSITKQTSSTQTNPLSGLKEDSIIKNALIIIGTVVAVLLGYWSLRGFIQPRGGEEMMSDRVSYSASYLSFGFASIIALIFKLLIFILILTLIYGIVMYLKENYKSIGFEKEPGHSEALTKECPDCKSKVKDNWKCCPYCGSDKAFVEDKNEEHQI